MAVEFLGDLYGGAAAAEGVEDYVGFVGGGTENALKECFGLLSWVAEAFLRGCIKRFYIRPNVAHSNAG
jgi:hypothetical protein